MDTRILADRSVAADVLDAAFPHRHSDQLRGQ